MIERRIILSLFALAVVSGCGGDGEQAGSEAAVQDTGAAATTGEMEGMAMGGSSGEMTAQVETHMMRMMGDAGRDSVATMMPMHRQMLANLLASYERDMSGMNMAGDTAWSATADSVRADLTRLAEMPAAEVQGFMKAHHDRVMRLMEMHRRMMEQM